MDKSQAYKDAIVRRRAFSPVGYKTLSDAGLDGEWVSPIQISSGNLEGPMLIAKHWIDYETAIENRDSLSKIGYLPDIMFNRVIDLALEKVGLKRSDIYITQVFHALTHERSENPPASVYRESFQSVTAFELLGRRPIALGTIAAKECQRLNIEHLEVPHPSARGNTHEEKANKIASALSKVINS